MQKAIKRVMDAYILMVTLSPEAERETRERLEEHLTGMEGNENALAVAGLKFLRELRPVRGRRASSKADDVHAGSD